MVLEVADIAFPRPLVGLRMGQVPLIEEALDGRHRAPLFLLGKGVFACRDLGQDVDGDVAGSRQGDRRGIADAVVALRAIRVAVADIKRLAARLTNFQNETGDLLVGVTHPLFVGWTRGRAYKSSRE